MKYHNSLHACLSCCLLVVLILSARGRLSKSVAPPPPPTACCTSPPTALDGRSSDDLGHPLVPVRSWPVKTRQRLTLVYGPVSRAVRRGHTDAIFRGNVRFTLLWIHARTRKGRHFNYGDPTHQICSNIVLHQKEKTATMFAMIARPGNL